jgi:hypothetical protein
MDAAVVSALIGLGGVVAGGLMNVPEFKDLFKSSKGAGSDLRGEWLCEWFIDEQEQAVEAVVKDRIEIVKVVGGKITATGVSPLMNEYKLTGTVSMSNVVTLTFQGTHKQTLTGVIILEVNTVRDTLKGFWHQISPDGKFVGGRTTWRRGAGPIQR